LHFPDHRVDWKAGVEVCIRSHIDGIRYGSNPFHRTAAFNIDASTSSASTFKPETLLAYTAG